MKPIRWLRERLQKTGGNWAITVFCVSAFFILLVSLRSWLGSAVNMLGIIPLLVGAWYHGKWIGILLTLLIWGGAILIAVWMGWEDSSRFTSTSGIISVTIGIAASLIVGLLGEMSRKNQEKINQQLSLLEEQRLHTRFLINLHEALLTALGADSLTAMWKTLAENLCTLFDADACYITEWEEKSRRTALIVAFNRAGKPSPNLKLSRRDERTLTAALLDREEVIALGDIKNTMLLAPGILKTISHRAALGLPLISEGQKRGAIILGYDHSRCFSEEEIKRGELAAYQISLAMTKALAFEEARLHLHELSALHTISNAFLLGGDFSKIFDLITESLACLVNARICFISLYEPATKELRPQLTAYGVPEDILRHLHFSVESLQEAWNFSKKGILWINSSKEMPAPFRSFAHIVGMESVLFAPLWDENGEWFGAILAGNSLGGFRKEDVRLIETISSQVVAVIRNARLLKAERRRIEQLSALQAIAAAATKADNEDQLIESVTHLIGERLYPDSFGVLLLDAPSRELFLHSSYRIGKHEVPLRFPVGVGIAGMVAKSGKPRREGNISVTAEHLGLYPLTRSALCVPLKIEDELLGVINAESTMTNVFTEEDEELLTIIAGQLATAIQRLRVAKAEHARAEQLAHSHSLIRALAQVSAQAAAATDPDGVMRTLGDELRALGMNCLVALSDPPFQDAVVRYISLPDYALKVVERLTKGAIRNFIIPIEKLHPYTKARQACLMPDPAEVLQRVAPAFSASMTRKILKLVGIGKDTIVCHLPLIVEGKPIGILWMWGHNLQESDLPTMSLFARQVAAVLQNASLLAEVRRLAITDDLTGIFNRRHFFELAQKEFARSQRTNRPLAMMIIDLDRFKQINDFYGHTIGDRILHDAACRMKAALRESDVIGRYGGEEFSIILPETDVGAAAQVAERLIAQVTGTPIETEAGLLKVQLSIGVAGLSEETPTLHALINRADRAMYAAKAMGHNRIQVGN